MDISVSRLNRRMALQLPPELPLGLVFVVGEVDSVGLPADEDGLPVFVLNEGGHSLRCRLSERAAQEIKLNPGDQIRAGGHLAFEATSASYYLLARDIEVLREYRPHRSALAEIIAAGRRLEPAGMPGAEPGDSTGAQLAPAVLPPWVEKLAPPEIWDQRPGLAAGFSTPTPGRIQDESWEIFAESDLSLAYPAEEPALAELSDELIAFLSEAMDGPEDVELTAEVLAGFASDSAAEPPLVQAGPGGPAPTTPAPQKLDDDSIEEFLAALEAALAADETFIAGPEPAVPSFGSEPAPVRPQVEAPVRPQVEAPIQPQVEAPVQPQVEALVQPSVEMPTELTAVPPAAMPPDQQTGLAVPLAVPASSAPTPGSTDSAVPAPAALPKPKAAVKPAPKPAKPVPSRKKDQPAMIPWYVVVIVVLVTLAIFALFLFLALNPDLLS